MSRAPSCSCGPSSCRRDRLKTTCTDDYDTSVPDSLTHPAIRLAGDGLGVSVSSSSTALLRVALRVLVPVAHRDARAEARGPWLEVDTGPEALARALDGAVATGAAAACFTLDNGGGEWALYRSADGEIALDDTGTVALAVSERPTSPIRVLGQADDGPLRLAALRVVRELITAQAYARDAISLHASAVAAPDRSVTLFVGGKGAGKTTRLLLSLSRPDTSFVANDRVLLRLDEGTYRVHGLPTIVALRAPTLALFPDLAPRSSRIGGTSPRRLPTDGTSAESNTRSPSVSGAASGHQPGAVVHDHRSPGHGRRRAETDRLSSPRLWRRSGPGGDTPRPHRRRRTHPRRRGSSPAGGSRPTCPARRSRRRPGSRPSYEPSSSRCLVSTPRRSQGPPEQREPRGPSCRPHAPDRKRRRGWSRRRMRGDAGATGPGRRGSSPASSRRARSAGDRRRRPAGRRCRPTSSRRSRPSVLRLLSPDACSSTPSMSSRANCQQHGIPALQLKGLIFAERLYGGLDRRPQYDIDVLVPRRRLRLASRILESSDTAATPHDLHSRTLVRGGSRSISIARCAGRPRIGSTSKRSGTRPVSRRSTAGSPDDLRRRHPPVARPLDLRGRRTGHGEAEAAAGPAAPRRGCRLDARLGRLPRSA